MTHPHLAGGTTAPAHHPSPDTLASYVAGTIRAGFDLVVAAHLDTCTQCRREVSRLEKLGGHLISQLDPAVMAEDALTQTLARLQEPLPAMPPPRQELGQVLANARRRWVAPGVWTAKVDTPHAQEDRVFLLRAAPGAKTARHSHAGTELTQILEGALQDGDVIYRAGDFVELDASHTHHPRVYGDKPCLCLFATEGRLVPTDLAGRIAFAIANV